MGSFEGAVAPTACITGVYLGNREPERGARSEREGKRSALDVCACPLAWLNKILLSRLSHLTIGFFPHFRDMIV